jgi:DNA-binding response OmpR family regulator
MRSHKPTVLVVTSDPETQVFLTGAMRAEGWHLDVARDAVAALKLAFQGQHDAAVLTSRLAGGGAVITIERIRASAQTAALPIVAIGSGEREQQELEQAGATEFVPEPVEPVALMAAVRRSLSGDHVPLQAPARRLSDRDRLARVDAARRARASSDSPFERLTLLASHLLDAPTAVLSLIDAERQHFKAQTGVGEPWASEGGTPLSYSFCQWVVSGNERLVIDDARRHPVLKRNRAVTELGVVAYAGVPLAPEPEQPLGSMCAVDRRPRTWTETDLATLADLGHIAELYLLREIGDAPAAAMSQVIGAAIKSAAQLLRRTSARLGTAEADLLSRIIDDETERLQKLALMPTARE